MQSMNSLHSCQSPLHVHRIQMDTTHCGYNGVLAPVKISETVCNLMSWSKHCCVRNVHSWQCHSHSKAQIILNNFLPDCLTKNWTLLCTVANIALHRFYKCVREYTASDCWWFTLLGIYINCAFLAVHIPMKNIIHKVLFRI